MAKVPSDHGVVANYEESVRFLQRWAPGGPWVLSAIPTDKKSVPTQTFRDPAEVLKWLDEYANYNIYFHVNPTRYDLEKKAERVDIAAMAWLHVDIDPRVDEDLELERTRALKMLQTPPSGVPAPTAIVFSGGGYQGFWRLKTPYIIDGEEDKYEDAKRFNQQLEILFGADNCHNVDRIMRLPGTINRPDARKKKKGRKEVLATLEEFNENVYELTESFTAAPPATAGRSGTCSYKAHVSSDIQRIDDLATLPVSDYCRTVIAEGMDPDAPAKHPSRSEPLYFVCCELVRTGADDDTIFAIITDPKWKISASVLDDPNTDAYALRQIERARDEAKPLIQLPGGSHQNLATALELAPLMREQGWYRRGRVLVCSSVDGHLDVIRPSRAVTELERLADFYIVKTLKGGPKEEPVPMNEAKARVIIECQELIDQIPEIRLVTDCPVLIECDGGLVPVVGFDETSGILARGVQPENMTWQDGREALLNLLRDYDFVDDADRARFIAAFLSPGLNTSGMLGDGRIPMVVFEADASQAGKGLGVRTITSVYAAKPKVIGQSGGGVGSVRESIDSALVAGYPFVSLDNIRGRVDVPKLESILTESEVECRIPHKGSVLVDPTRVCFFLTSNQANLERDLSNRSTFINIRKQPAGYQFHDWPEGSLVEHIRANQPLYLGATWAILKEWHCRGKQMAPDDGGHDFRRWARSVRHIVRDMLEVGDPIEGARAAQQRTSSPGMVFLRQVVLDAVKDGRTDEDLMARDLFEIATDHGVGIPSLTDDDDVDSDDIRSKAFTAIGRSLGSIYRNAVNDEVLIDGLIVRRQVSDELNAHGKPDKTYRIVAHGAFGQGEMPF